MTSPTTPSRRDELRAIFGGLLNVGTDPTVRAAQLELLQMLDASDAEIRRLREKRDELRALLLDAYGDDVRILDALAAAGE